MEGGFKDLNALSVDCMSGRADVYGMNDSGIVRHRFGFVVLSTVAGGVSIADCTRRIAAHHGYVICSGIKVAH